METANCVHFPSKVYLWCQKMPAGIKTLTCALMLAEMYDGPEVQITSTNYSTEKHFKDRNS